MNRDERQAPEPCKKLQLEVDCLVWASGIQKLLPNLPNGRRKTLLAESLDAMLSASEHPLWVILEQAERKLGEIATDLSSVETSKINWKHDPDAKAKVSNAQSVVRILLSNISNVRRLS